MKIWQKNLKKFLTPGINYSCSRFSAAPETLALLLLRELEHAEHTLAVTFPDGKLEEKTISALEKLMESTGIKKQILQVPECGRGKLLFPGGEARRARALNRILNEKFDILHIIEIPSYAPHRCRSFKCT